MLILKLKVRGGLGNQLFQAAFGYTLLKKYPESKIFIDKSWFYKSKFEKFLISKLPIKTFFWKYWLDELPISKLFLKKFKLTYSQKFVFCIHEIVLIFISIYKNISLRILFFPELKKDFYIYLSKFGIYTDDNRDFLDFKTSCSKLITIKGYFQDINYYLNIKDELRELLLSQNSEDLKNYFELFSKNSLSVSCLIRLGKDYIFNINPELFLKRAVEKSLLLNDNYQYIFFSDDNKKLRDFKLDIKNKYFCNIDNPLDQLKIASKSNVFIISNSSFAWWAYFLSSHKKRIIYKPNRWWINGKGNPGFLESDQIINIDC